MSNAKLQSHILNWLRWRGPDNFECVANWSEPKQKQFESMLNDLIVFKLVRKEGEHFVAVDVE